MSEIDEAKQKLAENLEKLKKVKVYLADNETGELIEQVNPKTSADAVTFDDGQTIQQKFDSGDLKGEKGDTGEPGKPMTIDMTFSSVEEMKAAGAEVASGSYVIIDSNDEDNGKLYIKQVDEFNYITNLSGPVGASGANGKDGDPFKIARTFISVDQMESEYSGNIFLIGPKVNKGEYVIINTEDKSDPDNGKLYYKGNTEYEYVANLAGPKGDKGNPFKVARTFPNIAEMNTEYSSALYLGTRVNKGEYVIVNTEDKSDPDNGKLYYKGETEYEYVANLSGPKGEKGNPFKIARIFTSISKMNLEYLSQASNRVKNGEYVIISTEDINNPDNGKLYYKGESEYEYVANLSGPKGDKGDSGDGIMVGTSLQDATQKKLVLIVEE